MKDGKKVLLNPPRPISKDHFTFILNDNQAKRLITIVPLFPCLNRADTDLTYN